MSGYAPYSPSSRSRTLSIHTKSSAGSPLGSSDGEAALYFATRNSPSPSRNAAQDLELSNSSSIERRSSLQANHLNRSPANESQPLNHQDDLNHGYNSSSDSERQPNNTSGSSGGSGAKIGILPRLVGGSHKTSDGLYHDNNATTFGDDEHQTDLDMEELEDGETSHLRASASWDSKLRTRAYWRAAGVNVSLILSWYFFSTMISVYNKWMFSPLKYGFSYPLFVTSMHMVVQFALSSTTLVLSQRCCGLELVPRRGNGGRARPSLNDWGTKVVPCAIATALDIGLSNLSLKTITLSFYTMCKSSNLAFVLFFAFLFRLEVIKLPLIGIIALITIGVVMMVAAETKFVLSGAIEVLSASMFGGFRWALTQMLLDREGMGMNNPVATIFWLSPVMGISMAITSSLVEDWRAIFGGVFFDGFARSFLTLGLVTAPGVLAFCMSLSEFALIQRTSVVTLSVAGIFKEVLTIIIAGIVFGDELTPINITGLCITILGIGLYNYLKYKTLTQASKSNNERNSRGGYAHLSTSETGVNSDSQPHSILFDSQRGIEERRTATPPPLTQEEKERRRKIEEEAEMDGWATSGAERTGQGWDDGDDEYR